MAKERLYLFDTTLRDGALTTGVDFSLDDKRNIAAHARPARRRLCRRRLSGRKPARHRVFHEEADQARPLLRLRHDQAAGPLGRQRSGNRGAPRLRFRRDRLCRQVLGLPRPCRAGLHARGESREHRRQREGGCGLGPRGDGRLRAFLRRLQGQSEICARLRQDFDRGRRALGGALRHQRRNSAARDRADRAGGSARDPRRPSRHPRAQRYRQCGRQFARRHPRRRAPGAGLLERARRTLRQRQLGDPHPDAWR